MVARHRDAGFYVKLLHPGLILNAGDIAYLETACDVEIRSQLRVPFQPVLIVGFQPVNAAVLEDEKCHSPVYFVLIFQAADLVVFI